MVNKSAHYNFISIDSIYTNKVSFNECDLVVNIHIIGKIGAIRDRIYTFLGFNTVITGIN